MKPATGSVQSLERAFFILETLSHYPKGIGLVELSGLVGLHKSTVHRLLATLLELGYVTQDCFTSQYRMTFKMLELSNAMLNDLDIVSLAKPHLDQLSRDVGESVHLVLPQGDQVVYVYKTDFSNRSVQMRSKVGLSNSMFFTAVGKAILATYPSSEVRVMWDKEPLTPYTLHSIVSLEEFFHQLEQARQAGYALDNEENELGIRCIGTAIHGFREPAIAAMSISAPVHEMTDARLRELSPLLLECRNRICRDAGLQCPSL